MQILSTEHYAIFPLAATRRLDETPLAKGEVLISEEVAQAVFAHKIKMEDVVICVQRNGNPDILLAPPPAQAAPAETPETVVVPAGEAPAPKKRGKAAKAEVAPAGDGDVFGLDADK